jgi:hypothetical protein
MVQFELNLGAAGNAPARNLPRLSVLVGEFVELTLQPVPLAAATL